MKEDIALVVLPHLGDELHVHVLDIDFLFLYCKQCSLSVGKTVRNEMTWHSYESCCELAMKAGANVEITDDGVWKKNVWLELGVIDRIRKTRTRRRAHAFIRFSQKRKEKRI